MSSVFFGCVGPIHWETYLREAYASLRGVKGSLRGGVLFGVAYAAAYARAILSANLKKSALKQLLLDLLWLHSLVFWPFVASLPFILAFCGFISFHFGLMCLPQKCLVALLRDQWLLSSYLRKFGGLLVWLGLSVAYAGLTRRLRSAYAGGAGSFWQTTSKSRRHPNPWCLTCHVLLSIPLYVYSNYDYASCLRNDISSTDTRKCLRGLRNHENFQVLRLRALFPVPLSSYSFHFKKKRCSYDKLEQIRVNASGWSLKSDWIPVFLDVLTVSVVWCYASRQTNRHQWAWLDLQMKAPNAGLGGFGFHATVVAKLEPHSQAFLKKRWPARASTQMKHDIKW